MMIIRIKKHPFGGAFTAINLFGIIFTTETLSKYDINHELIHTAQQRELLFIPFYIWYVIEWIVLCLKYRNMLTAYFNIRFEQEAYNHQNDLNYLETRRHYRYK